MITKLKYQVTQSVFQQLINTVPDFEHRIDITAPTGNFFYDKWVVNDKFKNTPWEKALNCLPFEIGQARLMKLSPGTAYYSHADVDDRYHLNISGQRSFLVDLDKNVLYPIENNRYWHEMDAGIRHSAVNFSNETRIQLVVRKLLQKNILKNSVKVKIFLEKYRHDFRYIFDDIFSPWLNKSIKQGLVNNFTIEKDEICFEIEEGLFQTIEKMCPKHFKVKIC